MGSGSENFLTIEAKSALQNAQIIFGASRMLEIATRSLSGNLSKTEPLYRAEEIFSYLNENPQYEKAAVVFSGDLGFFSGASSFYSHSTNNTEKNDEWEIDAIPGISSAVYFAAKLQKSWQNWKFLSLHGSKCNAIEQIRKNPACFFILSGAEDVQCLGEKIKKALEWGILSSVKCHLGLNLSYDSELIMQLTPEAMARYQENVGHSLKNSLFVLLIENERAKFQPVTPFLNDEDFIRAEKIPMTKKEVRRLSISSLGLSNSSVFYDIGSGSGSVTVEAARIATEGQVFAVECKEEALELTKQNIEKFCLENVTCILGNAPECLDGCHDISLENGSSKTELPLPTHVFIGGSKGNLREIVEFALKKNPKVRIVANFVSLENLCEMQDVLKSLEDENRIENAEITQIAVSRAERAGDFHLMKAQNPVYIVSFSGKSGEE